MRFDPVLLLQDYGLCRSEMWSLHYNTQDYSGEWTSVALISPSGKADDIRTHSAENFLPTMLLSQCGYFRKVIDSFQCPKESVRLLRLAPGSDIHTHRDMGLGYEHGVFRLHIPIVTSHKVDFIVGGEQLDMQAAECWYANFDLPHSVRNSGDAERVHLVIDCVRNEWSDQLFGDHGYDFELEKKMREPDDETKKRMIAELSRIDSQASRELIQRLAGELKRD